MNAARAAPRTWWLTFFFSLAIAGYAVSVIFRGDQSFQRELHDSFVARPWGIYPHAFFGALALLTGPLQFRRALLLRRRWLHRLIGRVYIIAALTTGLVGLYMSVYSYGGLTTHLGFGALGLLTATTTAFAYQRIRAHDVAAHREWMIRSFALIFAAVTLRIELPLLMVANRGAFTPSYAIVAWLCWVPNIIWAEWYIRFARGRPAAIVPSHSAARASIAFTAVFLLLR